MADGVMSFLSVVCWLSFLIAGVSAQSLNITMNSVDQLTTCNNKNEFRLNKDKLVFRGRLDATGVNLTASSNLVFFEIRLSSGGFQSVCGVPLNIPCGFTNDECYCSSNNSQVYELVYNKTAIASLNGTSLRIKWGAPSGEIYSTELGVPSIYDERGATLIVTVNSPPGNRTVSGSCSSNFTVQQQNTLQLCCSDTATPCYPRISVNGSVVADNKTGCASYSLTPSNEQFRATIDFSYSVCDQNNYINYSSCTIEPPPGPVHCCKCCHYAIPNIVFGVVLLAIGVTLSILLWLEKIEKKVVVIVYVVISIVFGVVLLVSGSVIGSQHCPRSHCPSGSTDKCDVCVYLIVLIAVFCFLAVFGIALLVVQCYCGSNAKKSISGGPNGADRSANAQGMRKPSLVAPTNNRIDTVEDTDMDKTARNIKPEHTGKKNKKWKGEKQTNEQESSEMETFDVDLKMGRNNPKITTTEQPQKLPPIRGTEGAISTSATSSLPLTSNFPTSIGKTADPHAARPTSIEETSRPLPKPKTQKM